MNKWALVPVGAALVLGFATGTLLTSTQTRTAQNQTLAAIDGWNRCTTDYKAFIAKMHTGIAKIQKELAR